MIDDKFSKLLNDYKERQEKESERQVGVVSSAWDETRRCNNISPPSVLGTYLGAKGRKRKRRGSPIFWN